MNIKRGNSLRLCLLLLAGVLAFGDAAIARTERASKDDKTKTRQAQAVSKAVYERIEEAQVYVDEENYPPALKLLNRLYNPDKLTEYEQANVLNYIGFINYNMDNMVEAIRIYKLLLAIPTLEPQMAKQTTYTMVQLLTVEERFEEALRTIDKWFMLEPNPSSDPFILKAQLYYHLDRYKAMIEPIENAMRVARERNKPVKENWYGLLNFAYFQQEDYLKVRDIQKILLQTWPKGRYWKALAGAYVELGEDEKLIYAYDAAHTQGMLTKGTEFVTMAQLYLQAEVPYKAATLIQGKMDSGSVRKNQKNYRLLSQAWTLAQEDRKAIPALQHAAKLTESGELDARLANSFLNIGDYKKCVSSAKTAVRKGDLKSPDHIQISMGMCLYNLQRYSDSKSAFIRAAKVPRSKRTANQWIRVIEAEVERNRQIRLAEQAAQRKRRELNERRAQSSRI